MSGFEQLVPIFHRLMGAARHRRIDDIVAAPKEGSVESLKGRRICAVATYKRDGTAVVTPVWFGLDGESMYFRAERVSGKAKRVARDGRVIVAPCTRRGRPLATPFAGKARVLDGEEATRAERAIQANFGLGRSLYERWFSLPDGVYVEVVATSSQAAPAIGRR